MRKRAGRAAFGGPIFEREDQAGIDLLERVFWDPDDAGNSCTRFWRTDFVSPARNLVPKSVRFVRGTCFWADGAKSSPRRKALPWSSRLQNVILNESAAVLRADLHVSIRDYATSWERLSR